MKVYRRSSCILAGALLFALPLAVAQADNLRVPSSVYRMDQFEEAKAKAMESEEPLVFLYTNPGST